jgi:glycosyltransferase involved in cell wall biosynthesis
MQVVVTSYKRLLYLRKCVESLKQDEGVKVYVADGGSDEQTVEWVKANADGWILFKDNPGADWLKTEGIKAFIGDPEFVITSDDIVFPKGWSDVLLHSYLQINPNPDHPRFTFCACNYAPAERVGVDHKSWRIINGVECLPTTTSQVLGAIMSRQICEKVGYFANYGQSGQGDWTMNLRLEKLGIQRCYFRKPMCIHIGDHKFEDFPEYSKEFRADEDYWQKHAQNDDGHVYVPENTTAEVGRR